MNILKHKGEYLTLTKKRKSGIHTYQVCDKKGIIKLPVKSDNGFIMDYGTRLMSEETRKLNKQKSKS